LVNTDVRGKSYAPAGKTPLGVNVDLKQELGKRVSVRSKTKLPAAASWHMAMLEQSPGRVMAYFQDQRVRFTA